MFTDRIKSEEGGSQLNDNEGESTQEAMMMLKMSFVIEALEEKREALKTPDAAS